jgi:uncharacterized protein (UPF0335 family)
MARKKNEAPTIGDNNALTSDERKTLKGYRDEIVRLELQKRAISVDIKEIYGAVKDAEFSPKALRRVVKQILMTEEEKIAEKSTADLTDVYAHALGVLEGSVFEDAARDNADTDELVPAED